MKKQGVCITPPDESNNILQMKTIFKRINSRNKTGVSMYFCYDYKSTNYNYNSYQKPQLSREDYKIPYHHHQRQISFVTFMGRGYKAFECKNQRQRDFCHNIQTFPKSQTYFFTLGYDIVSNKSNLLDDCRATEHVIIDKSKFISFDQNFEPGNHFVEFADRVRANNIGLKRGSICIYLCNSKGRVDVY